MRFPTSKRHGNILITVLFLSGTISLVLAAHLALTSYNNRAVFRSEAWQLAISVAEAGLEEALTQLNFMEGTNLTANGWSLVNGHYEKQRTLDSESYYLVRISDADLTIQASGYVRNPVGTNYISRTVQATVDTANTIFTQAMIAKKHIRMRSSGLADSYDSGARGRGRVRGGAGGNTNFVNLSRGAAKGKGNKGPGTTTSVAVARGYDKAVHKDNAGLAASSPKGNAITVDASKVYGNIQVASKGNVTFRNSGVAGSLGWVDGGNKGMEEDRFTASFRYTFPDVQAPFSSGSFTPSSGKVDGQEYQYVLTSGNYKLGKVDLKDDIIVTGDSVLYLTGDFNSKGKSIVLTSNATLKIYMAGHHFHMDEAKGSSGVVNNDVAAYLQYFGMKDNKCFKAKNDMDFSGVVYAPRAKIRLRGSSDFYGSVVGKCIHIDNSGSFHYDEALGRLYGDFEKFVITGWREL